MFPEQGDHQSARSLHYIKYKKKVCSKQSKAYKLQKNGKEIFEPKVPTSMTGPPIDWFFFRGVLEVLATCGACIFPEPLAKFLLNPSP